MGKKNPGFAVLASRGKKEKKGSNSGEKKKGASPSLLSAEKKGFKRSDSRSSALEVRGKGKRRELLRIGWWKKNEKKSPRSLVSGYRQSGRKGSCPKRI